MVMPARRYNAPNRRVWRRFVHKLAAELTGFWQRCWNAERFIIFQMVILQHARNVTGSGAIQRSILCRLDA